MCPDLGPSTWVEGCLCSSYYSDYSLTVWKQVPLTKPICIRCRQGYPWAKSCKSKTNVDSQPISGNGLGALALALPHSDSTFPNFSPPFPSSDKLISDLWQTVEAGTLVPPPDLYYLLKGNSKLFLQESMDLCLLEQWVSC